MDNFQEECEIHPWQESFVSLVINIIDNFFWLWHHHYRYPNHKALKLMHQKGLVMRLLVPTSLMNRLDILSTCSWQTKSFTHSPQKNMNRRLQTFDLVHINLCEPFSMKSLLGVLYILTFIDNHNKYGLVYFMPK